MARVGDVTLDAYWWRFTRYEIKNGYVVPAPEAKLEMYWFFDEVQAYRQEKARAQRPGPHEELANLDVRNEQAVLEWVSRWGLLGLLPHYLKIAEFSDGSKMFPVAGDGSSTLPWTISVGERSMGRQDPPTEEAMLLAVHGRPPGRVVCSGGGWSRDERLDVRDAEEFFSYYFPAGMPQHGYPVPLTAGFWAHYAEKVDDISYHGRQLYWALQSLSTLAKAEQWPEELDSDVYQAAHRAWNFVDSHAVLKPDFPFGRPGKLERTRALRLTTPTLWSALAAMVWMDWGEGRKVDTCKACNMLFVASLGSKDYCSPACKKTAQMRRWRARQKQKAGAAE